MNRLKELDQREGFAKTTEPDHQKGIENLNEENLNQTMEFKNICENLQNSATCLYSFVFRELIRLAKYDNDELAELLLMLYLHSVKLMEAESFYQN